MMQEVNESHFVDAAGQPAGGISYGNGFHIQWQDGPLGRHAEGCKPPMCVTGCTRRRPNGAFVEDILAAAMGRMRFYQTASGGKFACVENDGVMMAIQNAIDLMNQRTKKREEAGKEGTHEV